MSGKWGGGGKPCFTCQKLVYQGEAKTMTLKLKETGEKKRVAYHPDCFLCGASEPDGTVCGKKLKKEKTQVHEEILYCPPCFKRCGIAGKKGKVKWTKKASSGAPKTRSKFGGGGTACGACKKTCYAGEACNYEKKTYHRSCFQCSLVTTAADEEKGIKEKTCPSKFDHNTIGGMFEERMFCKKHWKSEGYQKKQRETASKWTKKDGAASTSGSSKFGGGSKKCEKCNKACYSAETCSFDKHIFHKKCFDCYHCHRKLAEHLGDANLWQLDAPTEDGGEEKKKEDEETEETDEKKEPAKLTIVVCTKCFKTEGYKGKQAAKAKVKGKCTKTNALAGRYGGGGTKCTVCEKPVYGAENVSFEKKPYHQKCLICTHNDSCGVIKSVSKCNYFEGKGIICDKHFKEGGYSRKQQATSKEPHETKKTDPRFAKFGGGGLKCSSEGCAKSLFTAEAISYEKHQYHPACFLCKNCSGKIGKPANAEGKKLEDGKFDIYCKKCFKTLGLNRAKVVEHVDTPEESAPVEEESAPVEETAAPTEDTQEREELD